MDYRISVGGESVRLAYNLYAMEYLCDEYGDLEKMTEAWRTSGKNIRASLCILTAMARGAQVADDKEPTYTHDYFAAKLPNQVVAELPRYLMEIMAAYNKTEYEITRKKKEGGRVDLVLEKIKAEKKEEAEA